MRRGTVESLLTVLFVILIILVVAILLVPAYLERLSRRNRARRVEYGTELHALRREYRRHERALSPFGQARAAVFRERAGKAQERHQEMAAGLGDAEELLDEMRCPGVFDYLLPIQHFLLAPADVGVILADARRLGRARARLEATAKAGAATQEALDALAAVPEQLEEERAALASRLAGVEGMVERERGEGIEALEDLTRHAGRMRTLLADCERATAAGAALPALDSGAIALESATAGLGELEARVAAMVNERAALDQRLRRATAELDNAQARTKAGPGAADVPPQVAPLLRRAAMLLNESAPAHRQRREYAAAEGDVAAATRLIAMGRDLTAAAKQARVLEERDDGASLNEAIAGLRRELGELLDGLGREDGRQQETALAGKAAQVRARADALTRQQDEAIAELEREAMAARERLERSWEAGQHLLRLADDDPLARRRARLLDDFMAAQRRPAALEAFRRDVAAFERVVNPWVTRVQATRQLIGRLRSRLPELIDAARAAAAPWNCLAGDVVFIQQRAADFETAQAQFAKARYRREAETLVDELAAIEQDIEARYALVDERATRLRYLEADVGEIVRLAGGEDELPPEHPDRRKWDRAHTLIAHHLSQARAAARYEDASVALLRAADVANKLAI